MKSDPRLIKFSPLILIIIFTLLFANLQTNKRSDGNDRCWNIAGDGRGYYAWLPAIFIYHDLNFSFTDSVEKKVPDCGLQNGMPIQEYRYNFNGKLCDKYYPGCAFLMLPFFTVAHLYTAFFTELPANGYSIWYFKIMAFSSIFYFCIGMLFFLRVLQLLKLTYIQQSLTIILIIFGSNIIYYTIDVPVWSHIYSFAIVSAFVYYVMRMKDNPQQNLVAKNMILLSLLCGLIFITRPVNIMLILLVPCLLWKNRSIVLKYFAEQPARIIYLLPGMVWVIIMLSMYKISTGDYFLYSYQNEGFNFIHPHLWQFLFHYDNGILPYTPLYFMPFVFLFAWYKKENRDLMIACVATLSVIIYINSSWWFWAFGLSFGSRTMLDILPLFGIPLALSVKQASRRAYFYIIPMYLLCCVLTMILYNQKSAHGFMSQLSAHITDYWPAIFDALNIK